MYCQKCRTPLKLDGSLDDLNPAAFKLLTDTSSSQHQSTHASPSRPVYPTERKEELDRVSRDAHSPTIKRNVASSKASVGPGNSMSRENPAAMSFVMLTESQVVPPHHADSNDPTNGHANIQQKAENKPIASEDQGLLSNRMESVTKLFEVLSARSDIDHPICVECTDLLTEGMQKRLNSVTKERDAYVEFLRQANADVPSNEETQQAQKELDEARKREAAAMADLEALEREKAAREEELRALDAEARDLDQEEEQYWRERNSFSMTLSSFQNERDRVNTRYDHDTKQLERLQRANVYNDTFLIGYDGAFGTINGLRLGRLPDKPVDWPEINAAWGQACLLLATIAEKLGFTFQGYRINPLGSNSTIDRLEYPQSASSTNGAPAGKPKVSSLDLYSTGELPLGFGFLHRRFDNAMAAFLECLRQLGEYVERAPAPTPTGNASVAMPPIQIPYPIEKDKIGGFTIKIGAFANNEEEWTKACKFTLTNLKIYWEYLATVSKNLKPGEVVFKKQSEWVICEIQKGED